MDKATTEAYLREWFQKSEQYDKEAWETDDEASVGYRCVVTDVIAFICANASRIELSSEIDRHNVGEPGRPKYIAGQVHQTLTLSLHRTEHPS